MHVKVSSAKRRQLCLGLNVLTPGGTKPLPNVMVTQHHNDSEKYVSMEFQPTSRYLSDDKIELRNMY